jgi:hypothetical protein
MRCHRLCRSLDCLFYPVLFSGRQNPALDLEPGATEHTSYEDASRPANEGPGYQAHRGSTERATNPAYELNGFGYSASVICVAHPASVALGANTFGGIRRPPPLSSARMSDVSLALA